MKFMIERHEITQKEVNAELVPFNSRGGVVLQIDGWGVFSILPDGTGRLVQYVSKSLGLQVDEEGRIKLID